MLVLSDPHSEKMFPDVCEEPPVFEFVPTSSGPVFGHHWKDPGSVLLSPYLQIFYMHS